MLRTAHIFRLALRRSVAGMIGVPVIYDDRCRLVIRMHTGIVESEVRMVFCVLSLCRSLQLPRGRLLHGTDACMDLRGTEVLDGVKVITLGILESLV